MTGSPERIASRERTIIVIVALVLVAAIGAGVWASGGAPASGAEPVASAPPSSAPTPVAPTIAAVGETVAAAEATPASDEPSPSATGADDGSGAATGSDSSTASGVSDAAGSATTSGVGSSASPAANTPTPTPRPTKTRKPTPKPTPTKTAGATVPTAAHFVVSGAVDKKAYLTLSRLKRMNRVSATYFSRGKEPEEASTAFIGVRLTDILKAAGLSKNAKRVTITAADGYSASFSIRQVQATYMDETRPDIGLPMIIAYSEDGAAYRGDSPFRLVMGQTVEGDYNRQYWVSHVVSISVL